MTRNRRDTAFLITLGLLTAGTALAIPHWWRLLFIVLFPLLVSYFYGYWKRESHD